MLVITAFALMRERVITRPKDETETFLYTVREVEEEEEEEGRGQSVLSTSR